MAQLIFKSLTPNYHKKVLEIVLSKGRKNFEYQLPFSVFYDLRISTKNKFQTIEIEKDTGKQSVIIKLEDGKGGDFATDFVLYHCDPEYEWSPINQVKMALKDKMKASRLSVRVLADALNTSPSQVMRLLKENNVSKQWQQLSNLAQILGLKLDISIKSSHSS